MKYFIKVAKSGLPYILIAVFVYMFFSEDSPLNIDKNPVTDLKECTIHAFNRDTNKEAAVIKGSRLVRNANNNAVTLYDCDGVIFDDTGEVKIQSAQAHLDGTGNVITFKGDVVGFSEPSTYLYTEELFYNIKKARIWTAQNVMIEEPEQTITGKGLESNLRIKKTRILSNPKVVMKKNKEKSEE
ncbi:MAG: LPS export ABC transporter periplasmic protein LptC [Candidatus Muiribacteriaceae bacterium]